MCVSLSPPLIKEDSDNLSQAAVASYRPGLMVSVLQKDTFSAASICGHPEHSSGDRLIRNVLSPRFSYSCSNKHARALFNSRPRSTRSLKQGLAVDILSLPPFFCWTHFGYLCFRCYFDTASCVLSLQNSPLYYVWETNLIEGNSFGMIAVHTW